MKISNPNKVLVLQILESATPINMHIIVLYLNLSLQWFLLPENTAFDFQIQNINNAKNDLPGTLATKLNTRDLKNYNS